jgi:hypothetical protein
VAYLRLEDPPGLSPTTTVGRYDTVPPPHWLWLWADDAAEASAALGIVVLTDHSATENPGVLAI